MSAPLTVQAARVHLIRHAQINIDELLAFLRQHSIRSASIIKAIGAYAVLYVGYRGNDRFEFDGFGEPAFVFEAIGEYGRVEDLLALPTTKPTYAMSMFGRVGLLGAGNRVASHVTAGPLPLHRTALEWLQAGCDGAVVVSERLAARELLDLPGPLAAADLQHGRQLRELLQSLVRPERVLVPAPMQKAA